MLDVFNILENCWRRLFNTKSCLQVYLFKHFSQFFHMKLRLHMVVKKALIVFGNLPAIKIGFVGKHKTNAFLQKLNIFDGSCFVKACHILIIFTGQTFNIWESNNCCSFRFINLFQVWLNTLLLKLRSTLELNCLLDKNFLKKQNWSNNHD